MSLATKFFLCWLLVIGQLPSDFHYPEGIEEDVCFSQLIVSDTCSSLTYLYVFMFITYEYFLTLFYSLISPYFLVKLFN